MQERAFPTSSAEHRDDVRHAARPQRRRVLFEHILCSLWRLTRRSVHQGSVLEDNAQLGSAEHTHFSGNAEMKTPITDSTRASRGRRMDATIFYEKKVRLNNRRAFGAHTGRSGWNQRLLLVRIPLSGT
jgi:hypothetical protein